jgi:hypothetical protein
MPASATQAKAPETVGRRRRTVARLNDPVVIDGRKYRINVVGATAPGGQAVVGCRTYHGGLEATVPVSALSWDHTAGLWRVPEDGPWALGALPETVAAIEPPDVPPGLTSADMAALDPPDWGNGNGHDAGPTVSETGHNPGTGTCSEHIYSVLVSRRSLGLSSGYWTSPYDDLLIVCPDPGHGPGVRGYRGQEPAAAALRCAWCGDALYPAAGGDRYVSVNPRRTYCTPNHRLRAFRERQAEARPAAVS